MKTTELWLRRAACCIALASPLALLACDGNGTVTDLYINEFMADNLDYLTLEDESSPDWIELYNGSDREVSLDGVYISDVLAAPTLWDLSLEDSIPAGGFLLLYADGETAAGHVPFRLDKGGEEMGLFQFDANGETVTIDAVSYPSQPENQSSARATDGDAEWLITDSPTPGESNG